MNGYSTRTFTGLLAGVVLPLFLAGCPTEDELTGQVPPPPSSGATDGNDPPSIEGSPPAVVEVGVNYSFTPQASDPDDDPLTFSVENLPDWLEFDETDGSLEGVPPEGSEGSYNDIVITVSDGEETDSLPAFTITVEPASEDNLPPEISGNPRRTATVGETWSFTPNASDPDGDPLTYSVQNAPSWTQFDSSNGRLSGVPQASDEGRYQGISITVSDGVSTASLPAFTITVAASGSNPPVELTTIPDIPFAWDQEPGPATRSGPLPSSLGAGEVLAMSEHNTSGDNSLSCNGTENSPAFVVGGRLRGDGNVLSISGSWCIFIGSVFHDQQVRVSGDHIIFREVEIGNHRGKNGSNISGSNIVLINSEIHHNQGNDRHGVQVGSGARNIWILDNHIHHNGGDGIQGCHGCTSNPPSNVYIGGNLIHSDRENAVDFKWINNVIVEGNVIHSYVSAPSDTRWCFDDGSGCGTFTSGSDGTGIVIGSDGVPDNVLVINNEVYGTNNAVRLEEGTNIRIEDNNFHDLSGRCLQLDKNGPDTVFSGNTCRDANRGIFQNWRQNFSLTVDGNEFIDLSGPAVEYETASVANASTLTNNLFSNTGGVIYNNTVARTAEAINALPNASGNRVE